MGLPVWTKDPGTDDEQVRSTSDWVVPDGLEGDALDDRVLFLHGGSYEWYSGVDEYYRPLASRIARESGMPVLSIDYRMAPEYKAPAGIEDALQALRW
mgnify:CR=1 FL=1